MAYAYIEYTGDGTTLRYTFPFTYLDDNDIFVYLDGTTTTEFTLFTEQIIEFDTAPAQDVLILIRRETSLDERAVDFEDGSTLKEEELDASADQVFYAAQEAHDYLERTIILTEGGLWDANDRRIINVANGIDAQDAVTVGQIEPFVIRAETAATASEESETNAAASEVAADLSETAAATSATAAATSATAAGLSETAAGESETNSAASEANAAASATAAALSETAAGESETNAAASSASALVSAAEALTSALASEASQIISTDASNAASAAASEAGVSATNAEAAADRAEAAAESVEADSAQIGINTTDIAEHEVRITDLEAGGGGDVGEQVEQNTADIATNVTAISANSALIATNIIDIATNTTDIAVHETRITDLEAGGGENTVTDTDVGGLVNTVYNVAQAINFLLARVGIVEAEVLEAPSNIDISYSLLDSLPSNSTIQLYPVVTPATACAQVIYSIEPGTTNSTISQNGILDVSGNIGDTFTITLTSAVAADVTNSFLMTITRDVTYFSVYPTACGLSVGETKTIYVNAAYETCLYSHPNVAASNPEIIMVRTVYSNVGGTWPNGYSFEITGVKEGHTTLTFTESRGIHRETSINVFIMDHPPIITGFTMEVRGSSRVYSPTAHSMVSSLPENIDPRMVAADIDTVQQLYYTNVDTGAFMYESGSLENFVFYYIFDDTITATTSIEKSGLVIILEETSITIAIGERITVRVSPASSYYTHGYIWTIDSGASVKISSNIENKDIPAIDIEGIAAGSSIVAARSHLMNDTSYGQVSVTVTA